MCPRAGLNALQTSLASKGIRTTVCPSSYLRLQVIQSKNLRVIGNHPRRIARAERDGTRAETRFRLSPKRTRPFKLVGASVQSTAGSRGVCISFSNAGYTMFGGGVRVLATHSIRQFPLHFPSRASPCATRFRTSFYPHFPPAQLSKHPAHPRCHPPPYRQIFRSLPLTLPTPQYTLADRTNLYRNYKHNRTKHILL